MSAFFDIWRDVSERISFHSKETRDRIPETPGIYAWFLPLWLFNNSIETLIDTIDRTTLYDSSYKGPPKASVIASFCWEEMKLDVTKRGIKQVTPGKETLWKGLLENTTTKSALQKTLLMSSIFMPPLYVGRTRSLSLRYDQHVSGEASESNTFNHRFTSHLATLHPRPNLEVSDLIFACIRTDLEVNTALATDHLNQAIEDLLLRLCKPVFSER